MKKIILCVSLLFANNLYAKCAIKGFSLYPENPQISLNSLFIVEGYRDSQKTIESFKHKKVFLKSAKGQKVELKLLKILRGQVEQTQAIFKPVKPLSANSTYYFDYEGMTKEDKKEFSKYNSRTGEIFQPYWKTSNKKFNKKINSNLKITFDKFAVAEYGCGHGEHALFKVKNFDNDEIWYKVELKNSKSNKVQTNYLIPYTQDMIRVGHGMCSGYFEFTQGKYMVRFTPMNADGKKIKSTKWIKFNTVDTINRFR